MKRSAQEDVKDALSNAHTELHIAKGEFENIARFTSDLRDDVDPENYHKIRAIEGLCLMAQQGIKEALAEWDRADKKLRQERIAPRPDQEAGAISPGSVH